MKPSEIEPTRLLALLAEGRALLGADADARIDLRVLVEHYTGLTHTHQLMDADYPVTPEVAERVRAAFQRRAQGEPVAYITGRRSFWRHEFLVTPATLIPRPETEHLVEWALEKIPQNLCCTVVDLGTGSGAIALSLAFERPQVLVLGCDFSATALNVAQANQSRILSMKPRNLCWIRGSWAQMLAPQSVDMIVSNPPYICADDPHLSQGDVRFEPTSALVAGEAGLDDYRLIINQAQYALKLGGWLLFEHGHTQAELVQALLDQAGFVAIETRQDLAGHPRNTIGQKPESI
ncbi:MAG: peptide chain release factor N(5)-glutamine methyltransferase [Halothiobacillus sp.]